MKIQETIDKHIQDKQKDRPYSGKIVASGLGHCYRKQYWSINREEPSNPIEPRVLRVFEAGNLFHDFVQNIILDEKCRGLGEILCEKSIKSLENFYSVVVGEQKPSWLNNVLPKKAWGNALGQLITNLRRISNEISGIKVEQKYEDDKVSLRVDMVDENTVYEIKSVHSRSFWHMKKSDKPITEQKYENVLQACAGAVYLKKDFIHIIFVSKDDLCVYEIHMNVTDEWKKAVKDEVNAVHLYLLEKTLPPASPRLWKQKDGSFKECSYCKFKDKCKGVELAKEVDLEKQMEDARDIKLEQEKAYGES